MNAQRLRAFLLQKHFPKLTQLPPRQRLLVLDNARFRHKDIVLGAFGTPA